MLDTIRKRRSIRRYQDKAVEEEKLDEILKAAMFAPTAMDQRGWEFIIVKNKEIKDKLSEATRWSDFAKDAPLIIVICYRPQSKTTWIEDSSIAAENIYLEVTNQGLSTCFVQILESKTPNDENSEEYIKKLLGVPEDVRIVCLMPIGYPAEQKAEHTDSEFDRTKIHREKF